VSLVSILNALKDTLESEGLIIWEFDYGGLNMGHPVVVILQLSGSEGQLSTLATYGGTRTRIWTIVAEVHSFLGTGTTGESHRALAEAIDTAIEAIEKWPHLKQGPSSGIQADVVSAGEVTIVMQESGTANWLVSPLTIRVSEIIEVPEAE